jgi:sulfatase maturation enzyme AslB (radical SAM superfamily)
LFFHYSTNNAIFAKNGFDKCDFDLTTNGTILTKEMIEFFKLNKFTIHVSVDDNENIHDASRIYHNGNNINFNDKAS